ncbi:hypothetical protein D3C81_1555270 [compost metagenome]
MQGEQVGAADLGQLEQAVELGAREAALLAGGLDFDDAAGAGQDEVGIGLGGGVFFIVEVQNRQVVEDAAGHGRDLIDDGVALQHALVLEVVQGHSHGDPGAGDRGGAGAAVGLDDVAVDQDLTLAERLQVDHGAQGAADQALDFLGAARLLAGGGFTTAARVGGAGQHTVFGRDPALTGVAHPARHLFLDGGGAQHPGVTERHQARALGVAVDAGFQRDGAELFGGAFRRAHGISLEPECGVLILKA